MIPDLLSAYIKNYSNVLLLLLFILFELLVDFIKQKLSFFRFLHASKLCN
jgi:hypothetical protein